MTAEDIYDEPAPDTRPSDVRAALLEIARPCVGLSFASPTRDRYVPAIFPDEPCTGPDHRLTGPTYRMAETMSSCGLFVRACWLRYGLQDARLRAPYQPGRVMVDLIEMAREAGAWRTPRTIGEVRPGDAIFIGGPEHVLLVEDVDVDFALDTDQLSASVVHSIDGGQKEDGRNYGIARRVRSLRNGCLVSAGGTPRALEGWIDWQKVAAKFG